MYGIDDFTLTITVMLTLFLVDPAIIMVWLLVLEIQGETSAIFMG